MPPASKIIKKEIRNIKTSFNRLARAFDRIAPLLAAGSEAALNGKSNGQGARRKPRLTAKHRQALKLQGKYMGTMRGLSPTQRAKIKKIRSTRGIQAAITAAQRLSK